ncbi:MAG: hypothetical protein ABIV13_07470 [Fimbriimonadales bacterium]
MNKLFPFMILGLLAALIGCRDEGVVGEWVGQQFIEGVTTEQMPSGGADFTLNLENDGSFTGRILLSVMMTMDSKLKGTYNLDKDVLSLTGTNEVYIDDGYSKEKSTQPFAMQLKVEKDRLTVIGLGPDTFKLVFRRKGTPLLEAPPKPKPADSDPKALDLIKRVKAAYASLKSYSDNVVLTSDGAGFRAKNAKIKIRFEKGGKFLLRADKISGSEIYESEGARFDGKKTFLVMMGGEEERPLNNALSIVQVQAGIASVLIPSLLLEKQMGFSEIDSLESVTLLPDEKVGEATCHVILSSPKPSYTHKLWVDAKTLLIAKTHSTAADTTTIHKPVINKTIPKAEFEFGDHPKRYNSPIKQGAATLGCPGRDYHSARLRHNPRRIA